MLYYVLIVYQQWPTFPDFKFVFNTAAQKGLEKCKYIVCVIGIWQCLFFFS